MIFEGKSMHLQQSGWRLKGWYLGKNHELLYKGFIINSLSDFVFESLNIQKQSWKSSSKTFVSLLQLFWNHQHIFLDKHMSNVRRVPWVPPPAVWFTKVRNLLRSCSTALGYPPWFRGPKSGPGKPGETLLQADEQRLHFLKNSVSFPCAFINMLQKMCCKTKGLTKKTSSTQELAISGFIISDLRNAFEGTSICLAWLAPLACHQAVNSCLSDLYVV